MCLTYYVGTKFIVDTFLFLMPKGLLEMYTGLTS